MRSGIPDASAKPTAAHAGVWNGHDDVRLDRLFAREQAAGTCAASFTL
jgi:hypothetical protein